LKSHSIKTVFFDYGGTLDADGTAWKERFYPLYLARGTDVPLDEFTRAFYAADDSLVSEGLFSENLTETVLEQVRRVFSNLGIRDRERDILAIAGEFVRQSREHIRRNMKTLELLSRRFRLGVISNNYGNIEAICRETGLAGFMDVMVDSRLVGYEKPDAGIFLHALELAGCSPPEAVMVGDNVKRDILGARAAGICPVLVSSGAIQDDVACHVIGSIPELERLLA
jgi:putative hydrolase of the HAD superfamily